MNNANEKLVKDFINSLNDDQANKLADIIVLMHKGEIRYSDVQINVLKRATKEFTKAYKEFLESK